MMTLLPQTVPTWTTAAPTASQRLLWRVWPPLTLGMLFVALAARSWGTWADPLIDFGRELYVPWRMAEGEVLYQDLAYFNGPFSPALNSAWFMLFGSHLRTLELANLALLAVTTGLVFHLMRRASRMGTASVATAAFLALFAFAQYTRTRNYNYVCPYSHEMTHGLLLGLAAMAASWQVDRRGVRACIAAGLLLGLTALTKPEAILAACVGVGASLLLLSRSDNAAWATVAQRMSACLAAAMVPIAVALSWLSCFMPATDAVSGITSAWRMAANPAIRNNNFYRRGLGTLNVPESLTEIAVSSCRWMLFLGAAYLLARIGRSSSGRRAVGLAGCLGATLGAWLWLDKFSWPLMERALPVLVGTCACWQVLAFRSFRKNGRRDEAHRAAMRAAWCLFALALLAKIALASRICQYGFVLAAPAMLTVIIALLDWLPRAASKRALSGSAIAWFTAPLMVVYIAAYQHQQSVLEDRSVSMGAGADLILAPEHARPAAEALRQIEARVAEDETVAVFPEGVMLNFLSARRTATKYITWMPPEVANFGEAKMLAALNASPPDWVIVAARGMGEYGLGQFGGGFAGSIAAWINANYATAATWGDGQTFGGSADERSRHEWRLMRFRTDTTGLTEVTN